ncbi:MAG: GNAT family N-acetyltransferase [Thermomicrobiales bacterium]
MPHVTVSLQPLSTSSWEEAARLEVLPEQAEFIESNLWSIAELQFYPSLSGYTIHAQGKMVGFLVWGLSPDDSRPWLYRFMIDRRFQGQGYGRAALERLIDHVQREGANELWVGYHRDNTTAARLYLSLGFDPQGLAPWGEHMACLDFQRLKAPGWQPR